MKTVQGEGVTHCVNSGERRNAGASRPCGGESQENNGVNGKTSRRRVPEQGYPDRYDAMLSEQFVLI